VVPKGQARAAAEALAQDLALLPQECMKQDRLSAYEGLELNFDAAMANEFEHGLVSLSAGAGAGIQRFADGAGRHGVSERKA
jgi:enoyl-CoA hydratase